MGSLSSTLATRGMKAILGSITRTGWALTGGRMVASIQASGKMTRLRASGSSPPGNAAMLATGLTIGMRASLSSSTKNPATWASLRMISKMAMESPFTLETESMRDTGRTARRTALV